ncbi:MAG: choice-of-anchor D domain-containing protein [Deltaproteobacteria bacterium]|nr:choice-of-anchor D domain-containing protein [Deltaproteobacteria bacterium]
MKLRSPLYIGLILVLCTWTVGKVCFSTECTGEIEFCSQVSSTESRESPPINCVEKFPDNAIPADAQNGYVLLKVSNTALNDVAIAVFTDPQGKKLEYPFEYWGKNYTNWYEVVPLPMNKLLEAPGTWVFTYYVENPYSQNRDELCSTTFSVGFEPNIEVLPRSLDFGTVGVGSHLDKTFTIRNTGSGTLTVSSFVGLPAYGFSFVNPSIPPFTIADGASQIVTVRFSPDSQGNKSTNVWVHSNGDKGNPSSIPVLLTGYSPSPIYPTANVNGIWKGHLNASSDLMNFYVQLYDTADNSVLVIVSPDGKSFHAFLDTIPDSPVRLDADDLGGKGSHISATFTSESTGTAVLRLEGQTERNYDLNRWLASSPLAQNGIWRNTSPGAAVNFYVQSYDTEDDSAIVIYSPDGWEFAAFLATDFEAFVVDIDDLGGQGYHLTMNFVDEDNATASLTFPSTPGSNYILVRAFRQR